MTTQPTHPLSPESGTFTLGSLQNGPACCQPEPVIQIRNLSIRYGARRALDNVTLDI